MTSENKGKSWKMFRKMSQIAANGWVEKLVNLSDIVAIDTSSSDGATLLRIFGRKTIAVAETHEEANVIWGSYGHKLITMTKLLREPSNYEQKYTIRADEVASVEKSAKDGATLVETRRGGIVPVRQTTGEVRELLEEA